MIRSLYSGATGMEAQSFAVDVTANNIANVNTTGFKRSQVGFQDLVYQNVRLPGSETLVGQQVPAGIQIGSGVRVDATTKIFTQGPLELTGNPLDAAINGEGLFQIRFPDGTLRYTRDGSFQVNSNGQIVNADGFFLEPAITIPQDTLQITIGTDGTVTVITAGAPNVATQVGQITLARFINPSGLTSVGRNLYAESPASGTPLVGNPGQNGNGLLQQGFLESSNVEIVQELIDLILAQRAFEFNSRTVRVSDSMLVTTNELIR